MKSLRVCPSRVAPSRVARLVLFTAALIPACQVAGPAVIRRSRGGFNVAAQQTAKEQLLLNLVRLRYRDTPYFLELTNIATSYTYSASGGASASLPEGGDDSFGLSAGVSFRESPTVSYTPLQGEDFVTQLLTPVDLPTLLLLYHSGWSIERILRISVQQLNKVKNAPSASGPTPSLAPEFVEFRRAAEILRGWQRGGQLDFGEVERTELGRGVRLVLRLAPEAADTPEALEFAALLGLDPGAEIWVLESGVAAEQGIGVITRSLMATLFYASHSVEVPAHHEERGVVTVTRSADGARFDWSELSGDLIRIRNSGSRPGDAYVAVAYRGTWFYVDDADLDSKSTFSLLMQLFALQGGSVQSRAPVLTIPVDR